MSFADPPLLAAFEREAGLSGLRLLGDPERRLYAAFGFGRGSVARIWLDPRVLAHQAVLLARGWRPPAGRPTQDTLQLGGDVVLGADGRVEWIHKSRGPEDRPTVAMITAVLRSR